MESLTARSELVRSRIRAVELAECTGERVTIAGWLHRYRRLGQVGFLILRDRSGLAQVVISDANMLAEVDGLGHESVLKITGVVVEESQAQAGVEIHDPQVEVLTRVEGQLPVDLYRPELAAQLPTILDHAAVANRHPTRRAYFEIASQLVAGFRGTLEASDFTEIFTPKIVGSATESGANVFELDYFERSAYLAQSPQFYKQVMVGVLERVYEVGPVFRAEPHDTARHLNEYVSLDAEMGFIDGVDDVMAMLRDVIAGMIAAVESGAGNALATLGVEIPDEPDEIPVLRFTDAIAMLEEALGGDLSGEMDLAPAHERWLGEWARREHGSDWLFVLGYPLEKRPFYTHPDPERPGASNGFDLIFRGLELVTGGQRLHRFADYEAALAEKQLDPEDMAGYLESSKYGMPPHGGFAIGLERFVARLTGVENVRQVTLFPRTMTRLEP